MTFDPDSETTSTQYVYSGTDTATFPCMTSEIGDWSLVGPRFRQMFSENYDRMAINFTDSTSNSQRVGYINAETGEQVDVTSLVYEENGFSKAPQTYNALFDPKGQLFFFNSVEGSINWVDPDTGKVAVTKETGYFSMPKSWLDGSGKPDDSKASASFNRTPAKKSGYEFFIDDGGIQSLAFYGESGLIELRDGRIGIQKAHPENTSGDEIFTPLTDKTDLLVESAIVDEKSDTLYFVGVRGETKSLFSMPMDAESKPKQISDLSPGLRYALMEFRQ